MKAFTIFAAAVAFATGALAGAQVPPVTLTQAQAEEIVNKYKSVLEGVNYEDMTPLETTENVVAPNYLEKSDSILSIISANSTLGLAGPAVATTRDEWYNGVIKNPSPNIITRDIFIAGESNILWYWTFPQVGIAKYPVTGFNLLRIDANYQIAEADIEFNSIAWAVDIFQISQYCTPPPSSTNTTAAAGGDAAGAPAPEG